MAIMVPLTDAKKLPQSKKLFQKHGVNPRIHFVDHIGCYGLVQLGLAHPSIRRLQLMVMNSDLSVRSRTHQRYDSAVSARYLGRALGDATRRHVHEWIAITLNPA